jgi:hypothetical protein
LWRITFHAFIAKVSTDYFLPLFLNNSNTHSRIFLGAIRSPFAWSAGFAANHKKESAASPVDDVSPSGLSIALIVYNKDSLER